MVKWFKRKKTMASKPIKAAVATSQTGHAAWHAFLIVIAALYALVIIAAGWFWHTHGTIYKQAIGDGFALSRTVNKASFYPKQPTKVLDRNNNVMKTLTHTQSTYVKYPSINPMLTKGLVAVEDKRFYEHHGVDPYAILRGAVQYVVHHQVQGGSTLTQQLVKNIVLKDQTQSSTRKIKEMVIAQQLEKKFTKHEILEFYLNDVYLGHGCYGMATAAQYYFSKDQKDLTIPEAALLIGMPNNQVLYDPLLHPKAATNRRNTVLMVLYQQGLITKKQFNDGLKTPLNLNIHNFTYDNDISNNYALSSAINDSTEELMRSHGFVFRYGFASDADRTAYDSSYNQAYKAYQAEILNGGYTIHTTIDQALQDQVQKQVEVAFQGYNGRDANGKLQPQVSSTIVDNQTGDVLAVVGGRTTDGDYLNRTYQSPRQPGSAAKPITTYAPAFERGYAPQSVVSDGPIQNVKNWYSGYKGPVTLRYALEQSINTVAVKLAASDPNHSYYNLLQKMEFSSLMPEDDRPIIAIGGFTIGVTTTEMASAYSSFARGGNFIHPTNVSEIYDANNHRMVYQNDHSKVPIYSENASYMMLNMMQSVVKNGTGTAAALDNYPFTAGKTGTTDNTKDSYFVGMTPDFTCATWVGYDQAQTLTYAESNLPMAVFKSVGTYLVNQLKEPKTDFPMPSTIIKNGDSLTATKESRRLTPADLIAQNNSNFINKQLSANKQRLSDLDYRLIYHLSKAEEDKREEAVKNAIATFDPSEMTKSSQYNSYLNQLQEIRYKNQKVRHMAAKQQFDSQILQLQKDLNVQQATLQTEKENARQSAFNAQKGQIEQQRDTQRSQILQGLQSEYQTQLQKTKTAYANNESVKDTQRQKLLDIMNQIRSYGGTAPDVTIELPSSSSSAGSTNNSGSNNNSNNSETSSNTNSNSQ